MVIYLSVLNIRKLIPLFLALIIVSAVVSFTAFTFTGFYKTALSLVGDGGGVLIVYSESAKTPQTSIISLSAYDKLKILDGVEALSPEVVAVALAGESPVIVRGIDLELFSSFYDLQPVKGALLLNHSDQALAGSRLATRLNLRPGDRLILRSVFSNSFLEVRIVGIFESKSTLDDELLVPIYAAQWLRGLPRDAISMLRVKVDPSKLTRNNLLTYLSGEKKEFREKSTPILESKLMRLLTVPRARKYAAGYVVEDPEESMKGFLERGVRINEVMIWGILAVIIFGSAFTIYLIHSLILASGSKELTIIRSLGASIRRLIISITFFTALASLISSVIGLALGALLSEMFSGLGVIILGSYSVMPSLTLSSAIMVVISIILISSIGTILELKTILSGGSET